LNKQKITVENFNSIPEFIAKIEELKGKEPWKLG